ncbi:ABC transporter substrate binding protein [Pseudobutyrivibrio xylanivorans]|uniref:Putative ABC transport system substrate-binding protein n=1 Tax=Pseudobutyrivibrio xylanivorans DSM 14809 TaxID=1123012 RepID=A0A1M6GYD0_PSEXY|nr:ABC transporter substrate binding protein [Pseudobutyrivibrio xylanivorans]SHJ14978.1 putative ABC transport system substrate-binding protein [Pseudobutyrivibrio xylanivorans DSM 14809]
MKKRFLSLILIATMAFSMTACGKKTDSQPANEVKDESDNDSYCYNISALLSEDNTYNQVLLQGFTDCLTDYLGQQHFKISTATVDEENTSDMLTARAISKSPDMIFTAGKSTLLSAKSGTDIIPIVATGIIDFKGTLRIASLNGKSWDKTTGTNVTGVSSKPSIVDQVSLMIEATKDLQTVGILFSAEDTDAIYQNEIFEAYLNQAGIPWKEYLIPSPADTTVNNEDQNSTALSASKYVAFSAKQGMDNMVVSLGETDEDPGLNSTSSTRVALVSEFWTGGKVLPATETEAEEDDASNATEEKASKDNKTSKASEDEEEAAPTLEELITEVCSECSAIYIPFGSSLSGEMDIIGDITTKAGVTVVAGDTEVGKNTLVTLFQDPYTLGYAAGKKAVKVFNGDEISSIKIGSGDSDDAVKLYNGAIAEKFEMEFPKSFKEINEFIDTYEYGSTTTRYQASGEE